MSKWSVLIFAVLALAGCCSILPPPVAKQLDVTLKPQETNNWCWAATTEMVTEFLGHGQPQCELANQRFSRSDCCAGTCPQTAACNMPGWTMFTESGFTTTATGTALTWDGLKREVGCSKRPMSYAYGPQSGGVGHVVVVSGYRQVGGIKFLAISDPWSPCQGTFRYLNYEDYSNSTTTNHWQTNYEIEYNP